MGKPRFLHLFRGYFTYISPIFGEAKTFIFLRGVLGFQEVTSISRVITSFVTGSYPNL